MNMPIFWTGSICQLPGTSPVFVEQHGDGVAAAHDGDVAHRAFRDQRLHLQVDRVAAHLIAQAELDAAALDRFDDSVAVRQRQRHRLLQQDVLSRFGGGNDVRGVLIGRAGHKDRVDIGARQQLIEIRHETPGRIRRRLLAALGIVIPGGHDLGIGEIGDDAAISADVAVREADDAQAKRILILSSRFSPSLI